MTQEEGDVKGQQDEHEIIESNQGNANHAKKITKIAGQLERSEGIYVRGRIQGMKVVFTADTRAIRTVISDRAYRNTP